MQLSAYTRASAPVAVGVPWTAGLLASLLLPLAVFAHKGLTVLFAAAAVAGVALLVARRSFPVAGLEVLSVLAALVGYAALSALWSIAPAESLRSSFPVLAMLVGVSILLAAGTVSSDTPVGEKTGMGLIAGTSIGLLYLAEEALTRSAITSILWDMFGLSRVNIEYGYLFNPANAVAALILWPWGMALARRRSEMIVHGAFLAAVIVIFLGEADAPKFAALVGLAAFAGTRVAPRKFPALVAVVSVLFILAMPLLPNLVPSPIEKGASTLFLSNSGQHRLHIWQVAARHVAERPLFGHGFNATRSLYGPRDRQVLTFNPDVPERTWTTLFEPVPLHPHNAALQIWLELGAVGALLFAAVVVALWRAIVRTVPPGFARAACTGQLVSTLAIALLSFGAWQGWWLSAIALTTAVTAALLHNAREER